jgi:hypothetical protein
MKETSNLRKLLFSGQIVRLDKDFANSNEVTVVSQTPKKLYTTVTVDGKYKWDVMTNRLTEL